MLKQIQASQSVTRIAGRDIDAVAIAGTDDRSRAFAEDADLARVVLRHRRGVGGIGGGPAPAGGRT